MSLYTSPFLLIDAASRAQGDSELQYADTHDDERLSVV